MKTKEENIVKVPVLNIRMMTDEEWNRIAYRNYLERSKRHEKKRN